LCRAGFEDVLAEEAARSGAAAGNISAPAKSARIPSQLDSADAPLARIATHSGWLQCARASVNDAPISDAPFVFERQRLPGARWCAEGGAGELAGFLAREWAPALQARAGRWTLHVFAPHPDAEDSLTHAAHGLGAALRRALCEASAELAGRYVDPGAAARDDSRRGSAARPSPAALSVLQVCRVPGGAWASLASAAALSDPWPGGVHRVPDDPLAPSRSYAKIEEAFEVMGVSPQAGESAVDLGAAPGGWSWAFVKRGCRVVAVDNGPMRLKSLGDWGGELEHVRQDGMTFAPARPVDWLASDMLIAPGPALGLVRRWHRAGWARRMVVNFKLPQQHPLAALDPVRESLDALPGFRYRLRQLYHDRREVTLMAECDTPPGRPGDAGRHARRHAQGSSQAARHASHSRRSPLPQPGPRASGSPQARPPQSRPPPSAAPRSTSPKFKTPKFKSPRRKPRRRR
jgi:hypothetical protein